MRLLLKTVITAGAFAVAYLKFVRPKVLSWGATADEIERPMPGDDILTDASLQTTRAITIDAPANQVWPWLVQIGPRPRAGAYTYDWVERLLGIDIENSDRILPEFQHLEPGQPLALDKKGRGIMVIDLRPERYLALQWTPGRSSWTFGLYPEDEGAQTRLISRNRLPGSGFLFWLGMIGVMEPGSLVMEWKMLTGIKRRAEALASREEALV